MIIYCFVLSILLIILLFFFYSKRWVSAFYRYRQKRYHQKVRDKAFNAYAEEMKKKNKDIKKYKHFWLPPL